MYRAIIFDLDGTLLDTLDDLADSANAVLSQLGVSPRDRELYKYFVGDGIRTLGERALSHGSDAPVSPAVVSEFVKLMKVEYDRRWDNKQNLTPAFPGCLTS
jgi:phosphoglycolate phosphatase